MAGHQGAKLGVPGIVFVAEQCECENCKGWMWSRHLIEGTRLEPWYIYSVVQAGDAVEDVAEDYGLTIEQVEAALEWGRRYGGYRG